VNAETLNIKLKLELGSLMNDVKKVKTQLGNMASTVKNSIPKITTESKKAKDALGGVTKASNNVKRAIDGIGDEAKESLSTLTSQSHKAAQALKNIGNSGKSADGVAESTDGATASLEEMQSTMQAIRNMDLFGIIASSFAKVKASTHSVVEETEQLKEKYKSAIQAIKDEWLIWQADFEEMKADGFLPEEWADEFKKNKKQWSAEIKRLKEEYHATADAIQAKHTKTVAIIKASVMAAVAVIGAALLTINAIGVSKLGTEIYNNAQRVGMSAQAYQEWTYVLERTGIEANELTEIVKTLTEAHIEVINGTEDMIGAFEKLGMSAQDVAGMGQDELWNNTIAALQNVENVTERTAIAYKIFGEDASKLTTVLNLSNADTQKLIDTYNRLGGAMSKNLIQNSAVLQNSLGNLRVAWQGLKNTLAQAVLPAVISVVNWITKAIAVVNIFLQKFFKLDLTPATDNMTNGMTGASGAVGDYTDSVNGAVSAVEKLKRTTMGFDELNIVSNPNTSSGSTGGSTGAGGGIGGAGSILGSGMDSIFTDASAQVEEFEKKISDFMDKWDWAIRGIAAALGALSIRHLLIQLATAIGKGEQLKAALSFKGIADGIKGASAGIKAYVAAVKTAIPEVGLFAAMFPKLSAAIASAGSALSGILGSIGGLVGGGVVAGAAIVIAVIAAVAGVIVFLKKNWDEVTQSVKDFFAENIAPKLENIKTLFQEIIPPEAIEAIKNFIGWIGEMIASVDWLKGIGVVFEWIGGIIVGILGGVVGGAINAFMSAIQGVVTQMNGVVKIVKGLVLAIVKLFSGDLQGAWDAVKMIGDGILNVFKGLYDMSIGVIVEFVKGIIDWFVEMWDVLVGHSIVPDTIEAIIKWFKELPKKIFGMLANFVNGVIDWFANMATKTGEWASKMWTNIKKPFEKVGSFFNGVWNTIKGIFSKVGTSISDGIVAAVKGAVNSVLRSVTNKINTFIGWINGAIGVINNIPGVNIGKITKLDVPQLATGGIVTRDTLARIGERGKEAVLPLEHNTGWMDTLANKINSRGGSDRPIHVHVDVDGTELGWAVIKSINNITRQTGGLQLAL
jgi:phage-related protein